MHGTIKQARIVPVCEMLLHLMTLMTLQIILKFSSIQCRTKHSNDLPFSPQISPVMDGLYPKITGTYMTNR